MAQSLNKNLLKAVRKAMNPHTEILVPSTIHCWSFIQPLSHCPVCTPSSGMRSSLTSSVSQGHPPRVLVGRSSLVVTSPLVFNLGVLTPHQERCLLLPSSCIQLFHPWHRDLRPRSIWSKRVLPSRLSIEENGEWGFTSIGSECRQGCITSYLDLITTLKSRKWKWIMATGPTKAEGLHYYATLHLAHAPLSKAARLLCDHRAPACFIPIFSRGAPSGQFLAPSTLIRILQGEDAASKLHRFRKPNKARLEKCVWFNWPNMSHISQIAYYPLPRFEQGKGAFIKDPEYRTNSQNQGRRPLDW